MNAPDLFGEERTLPASALRPLDPPVALSLIDAAAERLALTTGRPRSQERAEIVAGIVCARCGVPGGCSCV